MNKYIVLFFIFFLIMYAYMMMEPRQFSAENSREHRLISAGYDQNPRNFSAGHDNHNTYKKIYIERDESNNKDYRELMVRNTDDFEKTYYANLM